MWVEIWHFQMIFKLVFVSWNIVGIISLHSFLKMSIAYDSRYHATAILIAWMSILECYLHQWSWRWCNLNSPHPAVYHTEQPGSGHLKQRGVKIQSLRRYSGVNHMYMTSVMSGDNHSKTWINHMLVVSDKK